jgi:hypothetical protein
MYAFHCLAAFVMPVFCVGAGRAVLMCAEACRKKRGRLYPDDPPILDTALERRFGDWRIASPGYSGATKNKAGATVEIKGVRSNRQLECRNGLRSASSII